MKSKSTWADLHLKLSTVNTEPLQQPDSCYTNRLLYKNSGLSRNSKAKPGIDDEEQNTFLYNVAKRKIVIPQCPANSWTFEDFKLFFNFMKTKITNVYPIYLWL